MESEKLERIRIQKVATDTKKNSDKEIEQEKSQIRLEADRVISQQKQQQQHPTQPPKKSHKLQRKKQDQEQQAHRN